MLVTGASGQVGAELVAACRAAGQLVEAPLRARLDISLPSAMATIAGACPDIVFHAAALTDVERAEREPALADAVNVLGTRTVARGARLAGARLVAFSTDYVFGATGRAPYDESDAPAPLQVYGRSKRAGELAALEEHPAGTWIVRTAWVFSAVGRNFLSRALPLARREGRVAVVADQIGCPTYAPDLAAAAMRLVAEAPPGIYHLVNAGDPISRGAFVGQLLASARCDAVVVPVAEAADAAVRPRSSALRSVQPGTPRLPDRDGAIERFVASLPVAGP